METAGARLRHLLGRGDIVVAPGAVDGLGALLIAEAGFTAVHCTGGGIARSMGLPDLGQSTLGEVADRVRGMAEVCDLPLIVDVDAGFGNVGNLMRTVRVMERSGAAALHVEDMTIPHHHRDPAANLYPAAEAAGRIQAAVSARRDPDFVIVARTNCLPHTGLDDAIDRANLYADAGADLVYVEFFQSRGQIEEVARRVPAPKLISVIHDSDETPDARALGRMGYRVLIVSADPQLAAIHATRRFLAHLKQTGSPAGFAARVSFAERDALVGTAAAKATEAKFLP